MKKDELETLINNAWSKETCYPKYKDEWEEKHPSYGQSLVTSLVVNDFFGGEIARCMSSTGGHYYNLIDDKIVDLTIKQFHGESVLYANSEIVSKEDLLAKNDNLERYIIFLNNVKKNITNMYFEVTDVFDNNIVGHVLKKKK